MFRFAAERGEPVFSFEFFPPRNDAGVASLFDSLRALRPLAPAFVSVTWGAGGSSRGRTLEMVTRILIVHTPCREASFWQGLAYLRGGQPDRGLESLQIISHLTTDQFYGSCAEQSQRTTFGKGMEQATVSISWGYWFARSR